ncbi:MAG: inorganic phosphate transporter [Anaerolineae bacterium]|nr:inorganic phosphate transporter [Anaerolineae bacterium]
MNTDPFVITLVGATLAFTLLNGLHDSSNIVATVISSHAMSPRKALTMTAIAEFCGPFLFGTAVARTIGSEVISPDAIQYAVILAGVLSAITWNTVTWIIGIPSSSSHALLGGLVGAAAMARGPEAIQIAGLGKVAIALFTAPIAGLAVGYIVMKITLFLARGATPRINGFFRRAQLVTAVGLALSHGSNDGQKAAGIIILGLVSLGQLQGFSVPLWVIVASAGGLALGTSIGGWPIIRTLGSRFYKIRPIHGFTAQISSACVVAGASLLGGPVSTTQVVSSSILGIGAAQRVSQVRWSVAQDIALAWLLTMPMTALLAALLYLGLHSLGLGVIIP